MARTRGAKSSSPSNRKKGLRKEPLPESAPEPSPSRPNPPPVKPAPPKPPARRYLTRSGGRPLQKKPRVESSEPIDLTEQSPAQSPEQSPFNLRCLHQSFSSCNSSPLPIQSPVPSPAPKEKSKKRKAPLPKPQIQAEVAPKNIQSEARASPILPAAEEVPYGASASSKRFFLPRIATDFYQSMTSKEPTQFDNFRVGKILLNWRCIDPKKGILLEALYKMSEGFFFGPHHLILAALLYFEEKVHRRSCKGLIAFSYFQGCYAKFLSTWDTLLSLSWRESEYAESSPRHRPEDITVATPAIPMFTTTPAASQPPIKQSRGWPFLYPNIESCACTGDSYSFSEQFAQEMASITEPARADVATGSTSCHLSSSKSISIATSCKPSTSIHRATSQLQIPS
ncbi:hypothetical protein CK203_064619 [Vitis vinifera]|uniref:Uncharacterized protein n=1 Tax=Vitis vinifera TaxID=29760 RepID=A0A438G301_VITVI|nr:hypothetical protein CK203_064619 [Vitis vinifera]